MDHILSELSITTRPSQVALQGMARSFIELYSPVHRILQARKLEWVAILSSRGSCQTMDQTQVSHITGGFFTIWATREAHIPYIRNMQIIPMPGVPLFLIKNSLSSVVNPQLWGAQNFTLTLSMLKKAALTLRVGLISLLENTCIPVADSFWYLANLIQLCKV